jgi:hypothetical protein
MDLIERVFGVWPDGGDGSLELIVIVAVVIAVGMFVFKSWRPHRSTLERAHRAL